MERLDETLSDALIEIFSITTCGSQAYKLLVLSLQAEYYRELHCIIGHDSLCSLSLSGNAGKESLE